MADTTVKYLLFERGRYYYQRRVPKSVADILGKSKWRAALGSDRDKAINKCVALAADHDSLIVTLQSDDEAQAYRTRRRHEREKEESRRIREEDDRYREWINSSDLNPEVRMEALAEIGEGPLADAQNADFWTQVPDLVEGLDYEYKRNDPGIRARREKEEVTKIEKMVKVIEESGQINQVTLTLLPDRPPMDRVEYHERLVGLYNAAYGPSAVREIPADPEERDEYDTWKTKLERKISRVAPVKDTLSAVSERFFKFADVKPATLRKYRAHIAELVADCGDIPVKQLTSKDIRLHRDKLREKVQASSVRAAFTPISGMLRYAFEEELIDQTPMAGVRLPNDKRTVEDKKWMPFSPGEMVRILETTSSYWGLPIPGLSSERREAFRMIVRVLAFSALRPNEVMSLSEKDVTEFAIHIRDGKTESATRAIPIHPEISDFPAWLRSGGMRTFSQIETDRVAPVRQNFRKLLTKRLDLPINEERKALYSLRSTFQNAMRRAGAPAAVRRAILGHAEGGALRHYDDGPEFAEKQKWVYASDPRR